MSVELVIGHGGTEHVSADDIATILAAVFGDSASWVREVPELTMSDANTLTVPACDVMFQGRLARIGATTVTVESGTQDAWRHDLLMLRYEMDDAAVETCELVMVTGDPASSEEAAEDPVTGYEGLYVRDGATCVDVPLARVTLESLTPTVELVAAELGPRGDGMCRMVDGDIWYWEDDGNE